MRMSLRDFIQVAIRIAVWVLLQNRSSSVAIPNLVESQEELGEILWNSNPDGVYHAIVGVAGLRDRLSSHEFYTVQN